MGRSPFCSKEGLNKGAWTAIEDQILKEYVKIHGEGRWAKVPNKTGLKRCGKSCRLRWLNYLRPDIKRGNISPDEEDLIIRLHRLLGNRWSLIARRIPGRTDNEIKNYWNSTLRKKVEGEKSEESKNENKPMKEPFDETLNLNTTKEMRCTDDVSLPPPLRNDEHDLDTNVVKNIPSESEYSGDGDGLLPITCGNDNILMDFNVEQDCLYEIIHSDFWKLCEFNDMIVGDCNNI